MTEQTLHFDSPRDLQALLAHDTKNIALIEQTRDLRATALPYYGGRLRARQIASRIK